MKFKVRQFYPRLHILLYHIISIPHCNLFPNWTKGERRKEGGKEERCEGRTEGRKGRRKECSQDVALSSHIFGHEVEHLPMWVTLVSFSKYRPQWPKI
jgi:hypothetical protein